MEGDAVTAGWESLGDWLYDQARELGHIVKPAPRPVPVPSLDKSRVMPFEELREKLLKRHEEGAEPMQVLDARGEGRWKGKD